MATEHFLPFKEGTRMRRVAELVISSGKKGITNAEVREQLGVSSSVLGMTLKYLEYYGWTAERLTPDGVPLQTAMGVPMPRGVTVKYRLTPPPPDFVRPDPPKDYAEMIAKRTKHEIVVGQNPYVKGTPEWKMAEYILRGQPVTTTDLRRRFPDARDPGGVIRLLTRRGANITDRWSGTRPVKKIYIFHGWQDPPAQPPKTQPKAKAKPEKEIPEAATIVSSARSAEATQRRVATPLQQAEEVVDSVPTEQLADAIARAMWARYEWALTEVGALKEALALRDAEIQRLQKLVAEQPEPSTSDIARRFLVETA